MNAPRALRTLARQRGAGIVETLIGLFIGLLVVVVVYNLLAVSEGYKRMTTGAADAQITGLLSQFVAGQDAANGGNGLTSAYSDLINCHQNEADIKYTAENTLKPLSVLITKGVLPTDSDSFISWQGGSPHVVWPVSIRPPAPVAAGADIVVQSPNGYATPASVSLATAANPFWAIAIANDGTHRCALIQITNAVPLNPANNRGEVTLTQGALQTTIPYAAVAINDAGTPSLVLNLGPTAARLRYDVDPAKSQLRTTNCLANTGCAGVAANPIAQNVVWIKVQYGIDTSAIKVADSSLDGSVNCWTPADDSTCGDWSPDTIVKAGDPAFPQNNPNALPAAGAVASNTLNRIVAVRIGIVVRSDEPDPRDADLVAPRATPTFLFNCAANTALACPNRVQVPEGVAAPAIILNGWRYRTYEAVIPLRNSIFNATVAP